jgi:hypothetical protein
MPRRSFSGAVKMGFEEKRLRIPIADIAPLKAVPDAVKASPKYRQIVASVGEIGIIEPPVVADDRNDPRRFLLLDGHLRIEALKQMDETEVLCLISTARSTVPSYSVAYRVGRRERSCKVLT